MKAPRTSLVAMIIAALLAAAAAGHALGWFDDGPAPVAPESPTPQTTREQPPTQPAPATGSIAALPPRPPDLADADCILYPDGTRLPPLNGVDKAPRITFHRLLPFAPVVGTTVDARGTCWYVHANGVWSTTRYQLRDGMREAVGETMMPTAPTNALEKQ
jgi:hypothetical protein